MIRDMARNATPAQIEIKNQPGLSVILPVYNEADNIVKTIGEIANFLYCQTYFSVYEIIVVNDGSSDFTLAVLHQRHMRSAPLKIVTHKDNLGYAKALMSGARSAAYSFLLFMDADCQFSITSLNDMIMHIPTNDIVIGYRAKRNDPFYRILLGAVHTFLVSILFQLRFRDINCGFKLLKKEFLEEKYYATDSMFYAEMLLKAQRRNARIKEVAVIHFRRLNGKPTGASWEVIRNAFIDTICLKWIHRKGMH